MATLYDAYGNKVDTRLLKEELAAPGLGSVRQVISDHPSSDLNPKKLASLLRSSEAGDARAYLELAEDMEEKYLHYSAQLRTRKMACAGLEVAVRAAGDSKGDQMAADLLRGALDGVGVWDMLMDALDGIGKGYSVLEVIWDTEGKSWMPTGIKWRDPRWFRYEPTDGTTLLLQDGGMGQPLAPYKFIYHVPRLKSGLPIKGGLARAAAWSYLFSSYVLKDWVGFCEVFGQPIRVGRYPAGTTPEQVNVLKGAVMGIGTDCAAVIPDGMMIEFVEAVSKGASGDLYEKMCRYLDERVTVAILGQTLTSGQTQGGGGSMALGKVHDDVRYDILEADARQLSATLSQQLARPIIDLNLGPRDAYPRIELSVKRPMDLTALADQLSKLVPLGLRVDAGEVRGRFGLVDPEDDAETLSAPQYGAAMAGHGRTCGCQASHARAAHRQSPDGALSDQLEDEAADAMDGMLEPVRRLVASAKSYDEVMAGLGAMYPDMDDGTFKRMVGEAMLAASLAGGYGAADA